MDSFTNHRYLTQKFIFLVSEGDYMINLHILTRVKESIKNDKKPW